MLLEPWAIETYSKYLSIYDALLLEQTNKGFRDVIKYRFIVSRALITHICKISQVKYTMSTFNNIYDILYKLHLLDYTIFIVGSANYLSKNICKLGKTPYELRNIFSQILLQKYEQRMPHSDSGYYLCNDKTFQDLLAYTIKLSRLLSHPKIIIHNYLANCNPKYFTEKFGICCTKTSDEVGISGTFSNVIVCLSRILPSQIWGGINVYNSLLCYNTKLLDHNNMVNYPENTFFDYLVTTNFTKINKMIIKKQLRKGFDKMK